MWHNAGLRITRSEFGMAGPNASALFPVHHHHHHSCFSCSLLFLSLSPMHSSSIQACTNLTMTRKTIILKTFYLSCVAGTRGHSASPFSRYTAGYSRFPSYSSPPIQYPTRSRDTWPSNHVVFCPTPTVSDGPAVTVVSLVVAPDILLDELEGVEGYLLEITSSWSTLNGILGASGA